MGATTTARVVHCKRVPAHTFHYVGRPTIFGNPFVIGITGGDRDQVINQYATYFLHRVGTDPQFREAVLNLRGRDLACWCAPQPCHGDIILRWLEEHPNG